MFQGASNEITKIRVIDADQIHEALQALNHHKDPTNWVMLSYGEGKNDIVFVDKGSGGLDEFRSYLRDDKIFYGILEVVVKGDEYNPVKHVLVTWIGNQVPAGLSKARSAAHREELLELIKNDVSISAEYQTEKLSEIHYDPIAQALTRMRAKYHSSQEPTAKRQEMSRSHSGGGVTASKLIIEDRHSAEQGLRKIHTGEADWAILAYVVGKKDEVELVGTGKGIDSLRGRFPTNRIFFCPLAVQQHTTGRESVKKIVLVTCIGSEVGALQKARSGGQRQEVSDFILSVIPLHGHFQPNDASELTEEAILSKFHD